MGINKTIVQGKVKVGRQRLDLQIKLMELETFITMLAILGFYDKFPLRITPKNIYSLTWSIVHWLISSLMLRFSLFFFGLKTMKFGVIIFIKSLLPRHRKF